MAITLLPTPPTRSDPLNFATRADAFLPALVIFGQEANALATEVNGYATAAASNASVAQTSAATAQAAAQSALAVGNYVGEWSSLTGGYAPPISVSYQNQFYTLLTGVSDITAHTPGVSSVWLLQGNYRKLFTVSTNTTVGSFGTYRVTANCVCTLPSNPVDGQWVAFINKTGTNNFTVARNGKNINGIADDLLVNVKDKGFTLYYLASANDWMILV